MSLPYIFAVVILGHRYILNLEMLCKLNETYTQKTCSWQCAVCVGGIKADNINSNF